MEISDMEKDVKKEKQHRNDMVLIIAVLFLAAAIFVVYNFLYGQAGNQVVVTVDGKEYATLFLDEEKELEIKTKNGVNKLQIKDGYADMVDADCADRLCVNQKKISKKGETIICLPHKIVVEVISGEENTLDDVAG